MNRESRIRLFAFALSIALLTPMGIGFAHALHEHDNFTCTASNESHIHAQGMDCEHHHYFNQNGAFAAFPDEESAEDLYFQTRPIWKVDLEYNNSTNQPHMRGPPPINVK